MEESANLVVARLAEKRLYADRIIRLSEYSVTEQLKPEQVECFLSEERKLAFLGLKLIPQIGGAVYLKASRVVGSTRFVNKKGSLIVQVEPKITGVNFLRLLNYTFGLGKTSPEQTQLNLENTSSTEIFLSYFTDQVANFLQSGSYRDYSFKTARASGFVKGRPLVHQYLTKSVSNGQFHVLPCQFLDFSADVIENQIITYAVHVATQLASITDPDTNSSLKNRLRICKKILSGITVRRITTQDISRIRYNNKNRRFEIIHRLCAAIIGHQTISLEAGERISFMSFAVDMSELFEKYISSAFSTAFGQMFIGEKSKLRYRLENLEKSVVLDGLLKVEKQQLIVECKYKDVIGSIKDDANSFSIAGEKILGEDLYQAIAYAGHRDIRASASLLIYPTWVKDGSAVTISKPVTSFGWYPTSTSHSPVYILKINLEANFDAIVGSLKERIQNEVVSKLSGCPAQI